MLLSGHNIIHYLLDKNFVSSEVFVDGQLKVLPTSSRNHCFLVQAPGRTPLFIKQVRALDTDKITTLRTEANVYWLAQNDPAYSALQPFIPVLHLYDYVNHILITEALPGAESLLEYHYRTRSFPLEIAEQMGRLLVSLHRDVSSGMTTGQSRQLFRDHIPAIFLIDEQQLQHWNSQNDAGKLFLKLVGESADYLPMIQRVRREWAPSCLIHSDIKNANFLIRDKDAYPQLYLIDWEVAAFGDPCWDTASVFQSYFLFWIEYTIQQQPEYAIPGVKYTGFALEEMQSSMQTFWETYVAGMGWPEAEAAKMLEKTMKFCALKLIHTCTEASHQAPQLHPTSAAMLQLSFNILKDPVHAADSLLQIPQLV